MSLRKKFEITIVSASDLPDVGVRNSNMQVYATVKVGKRRMKKTPTDKHNEKNPSWNWVKSFTINNSEVEQEGVMVVIKLHSKRARSEKADKYIGEVHRSLYLLFNEADQITHSKESEITLQKGAVTGTGMLRFSYRFQDIKKDKRVWWKKLICLGEQAVGVLAIPAICYCIRQHVGDDDEEDDDGDDKATGNQTEEATDQKGTGR